jgi:hypothetical protein
VNHLSGSFTDTQLSLVRRIRRG